MSLKKEYQTELSSLLSSVEISTLTVFPISNTPNVPIAYMNYEVVLKTRDKFFGFTLEEAIAASNHQATVTILTKNGMHFFYTPTKSKQQLWIPAIYELVKETQGTLVVLQQFPKDGECTTNFIKAEDITDPAIEAFKEKDLIIFNDANFYIERKSLEPLAKLCSSLWKQELLTSASSLQTLVNH